MLRLRPSIILTAIFAVVFAFAAWESQDFPRLAKAFPQYVAIGGLLLSLINLVVEYRSPPISAHDRFADLAPESEIEPAVVYRRIFAYLAWFCCYYLLIWVFGFEIATALFTSVFLRISERVPLLRTVLLTIGVLFMVVVLGSVLDLRWPAGLLFPDFHLRFQLF